LWLSAALRRTRRAGIACLFTDWRQLPTTTDALQAGGWVWRGIAVWDKLNARPQAGRFKAQAEYIAWGTNGGHNPDKKTAAYLPGVFQVLAPDISDREHTTQKPVKLLEEIVKIAASGETVLDPFMGSGTTGVACAHLGRRFI